MVITKMVTDPQPDPKDIIELSKDKKDRRHDSDDDDKVEHNDVKVIVDKNRGERVKVEKD